MAVGILDSSVRMGFLTFLPFLLKEQGASLSTIGQALALVFIGGAAGKFACGWLGARLGVLATVLLTEAGTAVAILAVLVLPLAGCIGAVTGCRVLLNGTSSALYGTVPELVPAGRTEKAFAVFYTGTIGAGATAPILFGFLGDAVGSHGAIIGDGTNGGCHFAACLCAGAAIADRRGGRLGLRLAASHPSSASRPREGQNR